MNLSKAFLQLNAVQNLQKLNRLNKINVIRVLKDPVNINKRLEAAMAFYNLFGSPFDDPQDNVDGLLRFAFTEKSRRSVGINPNEGFVLLPGMTNAGKSTVLRHIFQFALLYGFKIWLFVRARDMRSLNDIDRNIVINNFDGAININVLNPCGIPLHEHANIFAENFCHSESVYPGTKNYLIEKINNLYQDSEFPSMHKLLWSIKNDQAKPSTRIGSYRESAMNRLGGMLNGTLGKVFDCSVGYEEFLLNNNCIFEIGNLTSDHQRFIAGMLLSMLYRKRITQTNDGWMLVGFDDAGLLFDRSLQKKDFGLSILDDLGCTIRKSKTNLLYCAQNPENLTSSVHANSGVKIVFRLGDGRDINFMNRCIGNLTPPQKEYFYTLPERHVIIKNAIRSQTFVGIIPDIPDPREVSDFEVKENNRLILSTFPPVVPVSHVTSLKESSEKKEVSDDIKRFLMEVYKNQYIKTKTEMYRYAGFSIGGTGKRISEYCEKNNLIKIIRPKLGRGAPQYPILLSDAYKILGLKEKKFYGKGASHDHIFWQINIAEQFKKYNANTELYRGQKHIDVAVETNDFFLAIEVEMTSVHAVENIKKDIENAKADFVISACKDAKVLKEVQVKLIELPVEHRNKTEVTLLSKLLSISAEELVESIYRNIFK